MKKGIRKSIIVMGIIVVLIALCTVPILLNKENKDVTKLGKLDQPETKQYSTAPTVGTEEELSKYRYEINETNKIVELQIYKGRDTELTVYSKYLIGDTEYSTKINNFDGDAYEVISFTRNNTVRTIIFQDGITWSAHSDSRFFNASSNLQTAVFGEMDFTNDVISGMFYGCTSLKTVNLDKVNFNNVTDMSYMFKGCTSLKSINLSNLDVSNVTDMNSMFYGCGSLTSIIGLENWDTSSVTNIYNMFYGCSSLTSIIGLENWNTSNVTNMNAMFQDCSFLENIDLSNWNTTKVTYMSYMFKGCISLKNINLKKWNTYKVTNMAQIFNGCVSIEELDLSDFMLSSLNSIIR